MQTRQDQIWNRAALEAGGQKPAEGDTALSNLLLAHGLVMNGGVVHAIECMSVVELEHAIAGFKYFSLEGAADALSQMADDTDEVEEQLNSMYWRSVPDDEAIAQAFRIKLLSNPEAFAPVHTPNKSSQPTPYRGG